MNMMKTFLGFEEKDIPKIKENWNNFTEGLKDKQERRYLIIVAIIVCLATMQGVQIIDNLQTRLQVCDITLTTNGDFITISLNGIDIKHIQTVLNDNQTRPLFINDPEYVLPLKNCRFEFKR